MYITKTLRGKTFQTKIDIDALLQGIVIDEPEYIADTEYVNTATITKYTTDNYEADEVNKTYTLNKLVAFNTKYTNMINMEDKSQLYRHYSIPKKKGGMRPIDDPCEELREALKELNEILTFCCVPYHTNAYAYVEGRSTVKAVRKLMYQKPNNFVHLDFHAFFPSTTLDFVMRMLKQQYPWCVWTRTSEFENELRRALSLAFLNNGMPQGSQTSPMISNLMMIPFDHEMSKYCRSKNITYVRYADDLYFSCYGKINLDNLTREVARLRNIFNMPFDLNRDKTATMRIGGPVWILGISISADKRLTVGNDQKRFIRAALHNFLTAAKNGASYTEEETQQLAGLISYAKMIEPEYFDSLITREEVRLHVNYERIVKSILRHTDNVGSEYYEF